MKTYDIVIIGGGPAARLVLRRYSAGNENDLTTKGKEK